MSKEPIPLENRQIAFFRTFGFLLLRDALKEDYGRIEAAYEEVWKREGGGHHGLAHDYTQRSSLTQFIDRHETLSDLLTHPRLMGAVESLLGRDYNYIGSGAALHAGNTGWHSDGCYQGLFLRMIIYLDPLTASTGCLRVIPGSHTSEPFSKHLDQTIGDSMTHWGVAPEALPAVPMETGPGDVILMVSNLKHASFGGGGRRRRMGLNFCKHCETDVEISELKVWIAEFARLWMDEMFRPELVARASPEVRPHLEQVLQHQGHLRGLAAKCRAEMKEPSRY